MSRTSTTRLGAFALSLLLVGFLVVTGSRAAFTDTTDNTGNSWATGTVALSDDDTTLAMFNASGLKADDVIENCLRVTYDGTLDSDVELYAAGLTGTLGTYLDLQIEIGDGGSFASTATAAGTVPCSGFVADVGGPIYSGTLASFAAARTDFGSGVGTWGPSAGEFKTYRFLVTVQDDNDAQGLAAGLGFVWEAQNQ